MKVDNNQYIKILNENRTQKHMLIKFEHMNEKYNFFNNILKSIFNLVNIKPITWGGRRKFRKLEGNLAI